mmetsp:Transcript_9469/g.14279  ORF Transcript_9469/g.14279 Transcript_9469/m.14279 type:complete len:578 (+) Transcript_9469:85-1818(+)
MAHTLKSVRYLNETRHILLQNENGPCPLLAAANSLLLKGVLTLPSQVVRANVASTDDVINLLAERTLKSQSDNPDSSHHIDELLQLFPSLQFGMDVNPKFTVGCTGYEYTLGLSALDLMGVELVHGWLIDAQDEDNGRVVGSKTYNELTEMIIMGKEASGEIAKIDAKIQDLESIHTFLSVDTMRTSIDQGEESRTTGNSAGGPDADADADADSSNPEDASKGQEDVVKCADATTSTRGKEQEALIVNAPVQGEKTDASGDLDALLECADAIAPENENEAIAISNITVQGENEVTTEPVEAVMKRLTIAESDDHDSMEAQLANLKLELEKQTKIFQDGSMVEAFLSDTSMQLTYSGLTELHSHVKEGNMCVFFRNNHFATLTKHEGMLYLLVTDLGYANVREVVWEKLDEINGDTEYADQDFVKTQPRANVNAASGPSLSPEQLLAQSSTAEADFQLALQLSRNETAIDEQEGKLIAAATEASLQEFNHLNNSNQSAVDSSTLLSDDSNANSATHQSMARVREEEDRLVAMRLQAKYEEDAAREILPREQRAQQSNRHARPSNSQPNRKDKEGCIIS